MIGEEAIRLIGWLKCTTNREDDLEAIDMAIKALKADAVQGKWVAGTYGYYCSRCDTYSMDEYNFCPNCGARMKGGDSE